MAAPLRPFQGTPTSSMTFPTGEVLNAYSNAAKMQMAGTEAMAKGIKEGLSSFKEYAEQAKKEREKADAYKPFFTSKALKGMFGVEDPEMQQAMIEEFNSASSNQKIALAENLKDIMLKQKLQSDEWQARKEVSDASLQAQMAHWAAMERGNSQPAYSLPITEGEMPFNEGIQMQTIGQPAIRQPATKQDALIPPQLLPVDGKQPNSLIPGLPTGAEPTEKDNLFPNSQIPSTPNPQVGIPNAQADNDPMTVYNSSRPELENRYNKSFFEIANAPIEKGIKDLRIKKLREENKIDESGRAIPFELLPANKRAIDEWNKTRTKDVAETVNKAYSTLGRAKELFDSGDKEGSGKMLTNAFAQELNIVASGGQNVLGTEEAKRLLADLNVPGEQRGVLSNILSKAKWWENLSDVSKVTQLITPQVSKYINTSKAYLDAQAENINKEVDKFIFKPTGSKQLADRYKVVIPEYNVKQNQTQQNAQPVKSVNTPWRINSAGLNR